MNPSTAGWQAAKGAHNAGRPCRSSTSPSPKTPFSNSTQKPKRKQQARPSHGTRHTSARLVGRRAIAFRGACRPRRVRAARRRDAAAPTNQSGGLVSVGQSRASRARDHSVLFTCTAADGRGRVTSRGVEVGRGGEGLDPLGRGYVSLPRPERQTPRPAVFVYISLRRCVLCCFFFFDVGQRIVWSVCNLKSGQLMNEKFIGDLL